MLIQSVTTITASTQVDDVLVNNVLAVSRGIYVVEYGLTADATGLILDIMVNTATVAPQIRPSLLNRYPVYPDDYVGRFGVIPGDRILLRARDTSGVNRTLYYAFRFNPMR